MIPLNNLRCCLQNQGNLWPTYFGGFDCAVENGQNVVVVSRSTFQKFHARLHRHTNIVKIGIVLFAIYKGFQKVKIPVHKHILLRLHFCRLFRNIRLSTNHGQNVYDSLPLDADGSAKREHDFTNQTDQFVTAWQFHIWQQFLNEGQTMNFHGLSQLWLTADLSQGIVDFFSKFGDGPTFQTTELHQPKDNFL